MGSPEVLSMIWPLSVVKPARHVAEVKDKFHFQAKQQASNVEQTVRYSTVVTVFNTWCGTGDNGRTLCYSN